MGCDYGSFTASSILAQRIRFTQFIPQGAEYELSKFLPKALQFRSISQDFYPYIWVRTVYQDYLFIHVFVEVLPISITMQGTPIISMSVNMGQIPNPILEFCLLGLYVLTYGSDVCDCIPSKSYRPLVI